MVIGWNRLDEKNKEQAAKSGMPQGNAAGHERDKLLNRGKRH